MNEEKNNIGVNNSLPPMGGVVANNNTNSSNINNIQDKYGLPPITNFTNFNDNYTTPTVDSNVSVFDLMNQFETVNTNNTVNNVNVENNNQNSTTPVNTTQTTNDALSIFNNPIATNNQGINDTQNGATAAQPQVQVQPQPQIQVQPQAPVESQSQVQVQPQAPVEPQPQIQIQPQVSVEPQPQIQVQPQAPVEPQPQVQVQPQAPVEPQIQAQPQLSEVQSSEQNLNVAGNQNNSFNNESSNLEQVATNNVNNSDDGNDIFVNKPPVTISPDSGLFTSNPSPKQNIVATEDESIENPNVEPPMINNATADFGFGGLNSNENDTVEIKTTSIEEDNDLISSFDVNNNTNNMDSTASNNNNNADANNNNNDLFTQKSDSVELNKNENNEANVNNKKKKNHKLLFIVLALITFVLLAAALVLAYFMFFKTDKLVCGMQDYSNEEFLLDESMVARFKGNNMTDAKITQTLTFTEENLEKKDSYLEELKNQYQGLGFNVSFVENEDGFEIGMSFTKKELENWYGTSLKNSSKAKLKKEMRESGYTCK